MAERDDDDDTWKSRAETDLIHHENDSESQLVAFNSN